MADFQTNSATLLGQNKQQQQQQQQQPTTDIYHVGNICFGTKSSQLADSQS